MAANAWTLAQLLDFNALAPRSLLALIAKMKKVSFCEGVLSGRFLFTQREGEKGYVVARLATNLVVVVWSPALPLASLAERLGKYPAWYFPRDEHSHRMNIHLYFPASKLILCSYLLRE